MLSLSSLLDCNYLIDNISAPFQKKMADLGSQNKDSTPTQGDISEEAGINKIDEHNVLEQKEDVESESRQPRSTKPTGGLRNIISSVSRVIGSTRYVVIIHTFVNFQWPIEFFKII